MSKNFPEKGRSDKRRREKKRENTGRRWMVESCKRLKKAVEVPYTISSCQLTFRLTPSPYFLVVMVVFAW